MNKVLLLGRLTRDVETRSTADGKSVAKFGIAVNRRFKNAEGQYDADFINCTAFGGTADFIAKYFAKGNPICVVGALRTGSYTNNDGVKVYTTEVVIEEAHFTGSKNGEGAPDESPQPTATEGTGEILPDIAPVNEDDLPF